MSKSWRNLRCGVQIPFFNKRCRKVEGISTAGFRYLLSKAALIRAALRAQLSFHLLPYRSMRFHVSVCVGFFSLMCAFIKSKVAWSIEFTTSQCASTQQSSCELSNVLICSAGASSVGTLFLRVYRFILQSHENAANVNGFSGTLYPCKRHAHTQR